MWKLSVLVLYHCNILYCKTHLICGIKILRFNEKDIFAQIYYGDCDIRTMAPDKKDNLM